MHRIADETYEGFMKLVNGAFEGLNADKWLEHHIKETPHEELYGLFKKEKLVAGMRTFDFEMNYASTPIFAGVVGMLAVDILHKKEKHAFTLMQHFFEMNVKKGNNLVLLHPFSVSFYKKMGFGLGTKTHQYHLAPKAFIDFKSKDHLVELSKENRMMIMDCYNRVYEKTHAMTKRFPFEKELNRPFQFGRVIGFKEDNKVKGYMVVDIQGKNLYIHELFYESPRVLNEFSTFLYQQSDQVDKIVVNTNDDELIHFLRSPESGSNVMIDLPSFVENEHMVHTGVGVMYRIVDTKGFLHDLKRKEHNFNGKTLSIKLNIHDSCYPQNSGVLVVHFHNGYVTAIEEGEYHCEVELDIADFSSLLMGAISFKKLYRLGLAKISDEKHLIDVNQLFFIEERPVCTKAF